MKRMNAALRCAAACLMLLTIDALSSRAVQAGELVRFRLVRDYLIVVPVRIGGAGPFDFLLDTGTNTTLVDIELAQTLGLRPVDRIYLASVADQRAVPRAFAKSLSLGRQSTGPLEVLCTEVPVLRSLDARIRGVLGQNFLSRFNFVIDYGGRRLEFEESDELEKTLRGRRVTLDENEGLAAIAVRASTPGEADARLILDSAIQSPAFFQGAARKLQLDGAAASMLIQAGTNVRTRDMQTARLSALRVGDELFRNLTVLLVQEDAKTRMPTEDGLWPTRLFRSLYLNNRNNYVIFNPKH